MTNGQQPAPKAGNPMWLWLLALGAIGTGAYIYGRARGREESDEGLEALAEEIEDARDEAREDVTTAALETSKLTARLAELARRKAG